MLPIHRYNLLAVLGGITFVCSILHFYLITKRATITVGFSFLFILSLAIGGRWELWRTIWGNSFVQPAQRVLNWQYATLTTILTFIYVGLLYHDLKFTTLMAALTPLLTIVYSLAKIRCWILGCCGRTNGKYPLQLLETAYHFILGLILLTGFYHYSQYTMVLLFFSIAYPAGRYYYQIRRNSETSKTWEIENWSIGGLFICLTLMSYAKIG